MKIVGTGSCLPQRVVSNDDLAAIMDTSDEWISSRTGIRNRHIATTETTTSLACDAVKSALQDAGIDGSEIDLIIAASVSTDKIVPSLACQIQAEIGAGSAVAFDINAACSGFLFGLATADAYFKTGRFHKAVVVGAEVLSKIMDWNDRSTCVLFGDGAGAAVVTDEGDAIKGFVQGSDGKGGEALDGDNRPVVNPFTDNGKQSALGGYVTMDGPAVYKFAVKHNRRKENLSLYLIDKPRTPAERQQNKETLELAMRIRAEREQEFKESMLGYRLKKDRTVNFLDYFQAYINSYTKKDIRMVQIALSRFKDFLKEQYPMNEFSIKPELITKEMMEQFVTYLQSRSVGEGAKSIFQRFKKVIRYAIDHDVMLKDPCKGVTCKVDSQILRKDVLSPEEIQKLVACHYDNENPTVRRAFIFCLYCGLRFCDVKDLTYKNVDYANRLLKFEQSKTKGHSASSGVVIPLNDGLLSIIGESPADKNCLIFDLPSYESCCKSVKRWVKRAGIDKHISWHCARHSFAVNILNNGANIKTVASLLGHSGLKHTEKYTRAVDKLKEEAINSLPELKF